MITLKIGFPKEKLLFATFFGLSCIIHTTDLALGDYRKIKESYHPDLGYLLSFVFFLNIINFTIVLIELNKGINLIRLRYFNYTAGFSSIAVISYHLYFNLDLPQLFSIDLLRYSIYHMIILSVFFLMSMKKGKLNES